ncbi:MAG: tyrosine-type recombinase/integrase [Bacilli bacterium]|nr:tyrosine-type recombinase/integrase [Bacilli bacterium]
MNKLNYYGPFKTHIQDFIELKKAVGYKYLTEAGHLKRFDTFTAENYYSVDALSKEIVLDWCSKKSYEKQGNLCSRTSVIRQFSIYLDNIGVTAYIIPKNYFKSGETYVPHIYTDNELKQFFHETDKCHYCYECPNRHLIMPILFRMIYTCGLRVSEARLLKVEDVDIHRGILTINHAKKDNSRLVPMSNELTKRCQVYSNEVHSHSDLDRYYFPIINNTPMTISNTYKNFRKFLWKAGISHGGRGYGPRIHDFRHSFAVHCLKKWSLEGKDLMTYLPILRVYLGHDSFEETAYYLRLTADVFPEITLKLETIYANLIPEINGDMYVSK